MSTRPLNPMSEQRTYQSQWRSECGMRALAFPLYLQYLRCSWMRPQYTAIAVPALVTTRRES